MRVKRLEVQGFKSFKDKTVIHFDHEITGIVGPNGSGKSNIVDAFFWVMGEQSYKHMRGSGAEDLIFNGSSKYSPMGLAEATLVLETEVIDPVNVAPVSGPDAPAGASAADETKAKRKEISVTRRVYRSGEGEYFINGVPARLKDIKELFMDTGVGTKGYSVIEQGQIGKIVNSKPEERRLIIEEAAGIAKYKARKTDAIRKMDSTRENLAVLGNVIQEIERTVNSLDRQAQKARQYHKLKDELVDKEMTWGRRRAKVLLQTIEALESNRLNCEAELASLRAELQIAENSQTSDQIAQTTLSKDVEALQSRATELQNEFTRAESDLKLSRSRQEDLSREKARLENERLELNAAVIEQESRLSSLQEGAENAAIEVEEVSVKRQTAENAAAESREHVNQARRKQSELNQRSSTLQDRLSALDNRRVQAESRAIAKQERVELLELETQASRSRLVSHELETATARENLEGSRFKQNELKTRAEAEQTELVAVERQASELEARHSRTEKELTQKRSRKFSLEELDASFEGFEEGPKAALEWSAKSGGFLKTLTQNLQVSQGFEAAVEGWLESKLHSVVLSDTSTTLDQAIETLSELRKNKKGRVSILLRAAPSKGAASATNQEAIVQKLKTMGFSPLGLLSQHARSENEWINTLCNQTIVVETFAPLRHQSAHQVVEALSGLNLVSCEGEALEAQGILRGGSIESDKSGSLLGRKRAIQILAEEIAALDRDCEALAAEAHAKRVEANSLRDRLSATRAEIQEIAVELSAQDRDVRALERTLSDLTSSIERLSRDTEQVKAEVSECESESARLVSEIEAIASERQAVLTELSAIESELPSLEAELTQRELAYREARAEEASIQARLEGRARELEALRSSLGDRKRRIGDVNHSLARIDSESTQFSGGDSELEARLGTLIGEVQAARQALDLRRDELEQVNRRVSEALSKIKTLHREGESRTQSSHELEIKLTESRAEREHLVKDLEEKYGAGCLERPVTSPIQEEMEDPVVTREMTAEEEALLSEEVARLRERILRLGEVNPMAAQEYDEQKKRHDHLISERGDLEESMRNLQEAIEHINKTSEERFKKAFDAIAERFERLFPIIFGGGSAKMSLLFPEGSTDVLDAGVEIMAQPPGKKVSNITLLSGGEKALTAVAFIFGIFMVKPSPFCLLDEVDAPLDDANIGKFNALLREMSAKSQFILITHNKRTMELNDTLYGVTMEEPGVSKMVSIEMH